MTRLEIYEDRVYRWSWLIRDDQDRLVMQGAGFPTRGLAAADANSAVEQLDDEGDDS